MKPLLVSFISIAAWMLVVPAQANGLEPILKHVGDKGDLACFTLTNPTDELLFVLASGTRVTKGPVSVQGSGWIMLPIPWHIGRNLNEGVVIPLPPGKSLDLQCEVPPGHSEWRAMAYVLRHLSDEDPAFTPSAEVNNPKSPKEHRVPNAVPQAHDRAGDAGKLLVRGISYWFISFG
jgi:hypothetical protein